MVMNPIKIKANVTSSRGFLDTLGDAESILHLKRFITTPGIAGTATAQELAALVPKDGPFLAMGWREAARRIKEIIIGKKIEVISEEAAWLPIQVHAIYCPNVPGTKASLTLEYSESGEATCRLEFLGVGGGGEFSIEFAVNDKLEVEAESAIVSYQILTTWQRCSLVSKNGSAIDFPRLGAVHEDCQRIETKTLATGAKPPPGTALKQLLEFDQRNTKGILTRRHSIKAGTKWTGSIGVKLEKLGFECASEFVGTRNWNSEYEYLLQPGHLYRVVQAVGSLDWWWVVDTKGDMKGVS
jgi:hypothetical protein